MKLPALNILDEKNKVLHEISEEVIFPLSSDEKKLIQDSLLYLKYSQIEKIREKYNLRAGMGLAFVQLGIKKRIFVICEDLQDGNFKNYVVINPKVISHSEELIYVSEGEGCLSVNREVEGIVPRYARMNVEAYDENGNKYTIRVREDISIAFQHEIDHLNGIMFPDKINNKYPFKDIEKMRGI